MRPIRFRALPSTLPILSAESAASQDYSAEKLLSDTSSPAGGQEEEFA
jgi:hypothetical protein